MTKYVSRALLVLPFFCGPLAEAQTVDQLVADPRALKAEFDRCESLGMASEDDARCKIAVEAEHKRFFGTGKSQYTPKPVQVFPGQPEPVIGPVQPAGKTPNG
jgi:conjugative transfer region protein TrbK